MQLNKLFIGIGIISLGFIGLAKAYSVNVIDYAFEKTFFLSEDQAKEEALGINLDLDTLQNINRNISNIVLVGNDNSVIDFTLALPKPGIIKNAKVIENTCLQI